MTEKRICEVCNEREATGVASMSSPFSCSICLECLQAGAEPYWLLVGNTACIGGYDKCAEWWRQVVNRTIDHLGKDWDQFHKDVADAIAEIDGYEDQLEGEAILREK